MILLFNKPYLVLCQFKAETGRQTLADYLDAPNYHAAGRLDHDSEGLLVLTDNGALQHRICHPKQKLTKTYWVQVEGIPSNEALNQFRRGLILNDGPTLPAEVELIEQPHSLWPRTPPIRFRAQIPTQWLQVRLNEGRNRQIRRMTAAIGHPTLRLIRCQIGPWSLEDLAPGQHRFATIPSSLLRPDTTQTQRTIVSKKRPTYQGKPLY